MSGARSTCVRADAIDSAVRSCGDKRQRARWLSPSRSSETTDLHVLNENELGKSNQAKTYAASARIDFKRVMAREWSWEMRGSLTPSISPSSLNLIPRK